MHRPLVYCGRADGLRGRCQENPSLCAPCDGAERVMTGNVDIIAASTNTTAEAAAGNKTGR